MHQRQHSWEILGQRYEPASVLSGTRSALGVVTLRFAELRCGDSCGRMAALPQESSETRRPFLKDDFLGGIIGVTVTPTSSSSSLTSTSAFVVNFSRLTDSRAFSHHGAPLKNGESAVW